MKTPHSTLYRYTAETIASANRLGNGTVDEQSHKLGMERGEPLIIMLDCLLKYAEAYKIRNESLLADDMVMGDYWLDSLKAVHSLLNGDGEVAMRIGRTTDSKSNGACESVFADCLTMAGFDHNTLGI